MTPSINAVFSSIRQRLVQESNAAAWGPEMQGTTPTNLSGSKPGDGGATNETDIPDALDRYLGNIAQRQMANGHSESEAWSQISSTASRLAREGVLPKMPSETADDKDIAEWLGKAATVGFTQAVEQDARG